MRTKPRNLPFALILALVMTTAAPLAMASESTMATGKLRVEGPDDPLAVKIAHAYYITGIDRFDQTKTVRSIVFTTDDQRATIDACEDLRCAMLSSSDGIKIDLDDSGMVNWWAHVYPIQYSGTSGPEFLKLSVDSADRIAGSFKLEGSGATTAIEFDASLVRDFRKAD